MKILYWTLLSLFPSFVFGQLKGIVMGSDNQTKEPIYGASIQLLNNSLGTRTNDEGKFELILPKKLPDTLVISAFGYVSDSVQITKSDRFIGIEITLYSTNLLGEVVIAAKKASHSISKMKTLHVESLSSDELRKAACCNLSESFETNASVDVNLTDAVSGAKKIQMLGLDGVYTQIQLENIPYLRGLESSLGLNNIPGTWIESIQISKGSGTVVNGYESMAGLVNLELKKPLSMEKVYLNAYVNRMGRNELNFNAGYELGKKEKWSSGLFAHASSFPIEMDLNKDGFRDIPMGSNFSLLNRYNYEGEKMEAQFGFNIYQHQKDGGQVSRLRNQNYFDVLLLSQHIDVFAKTGFFLKKPGHSIGILYDLKYHINESKFGVKEFNGEEKRGYINAIYDGIIGTTDHKYKIGISSVYLDLKQQMNNLNDDRFEFVPGVFSEYTYTGSRLSAVLGARFDYHNLFKEQFSPRIHLKYVLTEYTDLRFTSGKGWRVPNYMVDNLSLMATSRNWVAPIQTLPEVSWNMGGSFVQQFKFRKRLSTITLDYYYTFFQNQLIVDRDENVNQIVFKNLESNSFSHSFQSELTIPFNDQFEVRT
ncbi:MAG: TonB-dependent receptor, partial [Crocinitomicaceae bacterium]